jgi:hypothetical protein
VSKILLQRLLVEEAVNRDNFLLGEKNLENFLMFLFWKQGQRCPENLMCHRKNVKYNFPCYGFSFQTSLAFLLRCRDSNVLPTFTLVTQHIKTQAAHTILLCTRHALLRECIHYNRSNIDQTSKEIYSIYLLITHKLAAADWEEVNHITAQQAAKTATLSTSKQMKYNQLLKKAHPPTPKLDEDRTVVDVSSQSFDTTTTAILARGLNFVVTSRHLPTEDIVCRVEASIAHLPSSTTEQGYLHNTSRQGERHCHCELLGLL